LRALGLKRLLPAARKHRRQVRFIRETLTSSRKSDDRRVIASLSTVPERIGNLGPTIRSLLKQTRPPDEIVLAVPEFSIRNDGLMRSRGCFAIAASACFALSQGLGTSHKVYPDRSRRIGGGPGKYIGNGCG